MALTVVTREDHFEDSNKRFISIAPQHIAFNARFVRDAAIDISYRVTLYADPDTITLGFEFHKEDRPNSLSICGKNRQQGLFCASLGLVNKFSWVKSITKLPPKDRRFFNPKKQGSIWVIQLCPAFEERKARESEDIPSDATGIYRYLRSAGEIVYIGRGEIKKRLKSPERKDWDFDVIEYSLLKNPDSQVKWEAYWIEKFNKQHGQLPFYNKVSGFETSENNH